MVCRSKVKVLGGEGQPHFDLEESAGRYLIVVASGNENQEAGTSPLSPLVHGFQPAPCHGLDFRQLLLSFQSQNVNYNEKVKAIAVSAVGARFSTGTLP